MPQLTSPSADRSQFQLPALSVRGRRRDDARFRFQRDRAVGHRPASRPVPCQRRAGGVHASACCVRTACRCAASRPSRWSTRSTSPPATPSSRRASIDRFKRGADICAALDARYLFLTPGRGFENEDPRAAWARSSEALAEIADHARQAGVRCLLEPLQRVESNIVTDAASLHRMFLEIGAETVDIVLDTVAMATAGDTVADYLRLFGQRIAHVHVVDGSPSGHLVWGDGTLPLGRYLSELAGSRLCRHAHLRTLRQRLLRARPRRRMAAQPRRHRPAISIAAR